MAEGSEQLLTVLTTYDMVFMWTQTRLGGSTSYFYCLSSDLTVRIWKMSQKCLVAGLVKFFEKTTGQILRGVICLCTHGGEHSRQAPDELDILTSVPCVWGR